MSFDTSITKASELAAASLRDVAKTLSVQQLSRLTLPEIEAVVVDWRVCQGGAFQRKR